MFHDGFATLTGKVINLDNRPSTASRIHATACKVMLWTFALGLVFG
jgi:hypothetical protein